MQDNPGGDDHNAHDDHEPGDVNGNVDPSFGKKPKTQGRGDKPTGRAPRAAKAPRTARAPRLGKAADAGDVAVVAPKPTVEIIVRGPGQPRVPRKPRVARPVDVDGGVSSELGVSAAAVGAEGSSADNSSDNAAAPNSGEGGPGNGRGRNRNRRGGRGRNERRDGALRPEGAVSAERAVRLGPDGQPIPYEPRPPRPPREARPPRDQRQPREQRAPRGDSLPQRVNVDGLAAVELEVGAEDTGHRTEAAVITNWVLDNEPNPGAFGDPSRPMDRSARRNRNHRDKRNKGAPPVRVGQGPRDRMPQPPSQAFVDEAGNPIEAPEGVTVSGVNELGERDGERLHKVLAQQGLGSRRDMEAMIESGEVQVNGVKAVVGQIVNEKDRVHVNRRRVNVKLGDDKPRILIYHKQAGEIVSRDDPEQRDTVFDRLPKPDHGKWVAVGRLDYNSEGLLLFTTYGELANRFMHPRYEILREYSVRVLGELTPEQEDMLMDGIELDDGPARVLSLDRIDRDSDAANHWYRLTLNEGRNREVRRMFEHLGLTVSRLIRTRYGVVQMPSWLKRGQFKQLDEAETFDVLESVGLRSKKKLEKAARFGGKNRLPQQPLGPMRSATEHEAIFTGVPTDVGMGGGRGRRQGQGIGNTAGPGGGRRTGGRFRTGAGAASAATQQQFPGFGGASEMPVTGRRQRTPGNKIKRGADGEVNGNVAPGYQPNAGGGGNRPPRGRNGQGGQAGQGRRNGRGGQGGGNAAAGAGYVPVDGAAPAGGVGAEGQKRGRRRRGRGPGNGPRVDGAPAPVGAPPMPDFE